MGRVENRAICFFGSHRKLTPSPNPRVLWTIAYLETRELYFCRYWFQKTYGREN